MSLPKSVQAQAEAAAKHFASNENPEGDNAPAPEGDEQNPQASETPTPDEPSQPDTEQPAAPGAAKPDEETLYLRNRLDVVLGKYNKEVPALHREINDLKQSITEKDRRIQELESSPSQSASNGSLEGVDLDKMRQDYGDDLVNDVVSLVNAKGGDNGKVETLERELAELRSRDQAREQERHQDVEARFWVTLERAVPKFREINADPGFHQHLASFDPQTGKQRQQMLTEAQQALDAQAVAGIFHSYLQAGSPASKPQVPESQVEPRTTRTTNAPQGKKLWARAEIGQFYRDKNAGKYSDDEASRLEADIFAAQSEGRIR